MCVNLLPFLPALAMGAASTGLGIMGSINDNKAANAKGKADMAIAQRDFAINSAQQQAQTEETRQDVSRSGVANTIATSQAQGAAITQFGAAGIGGGALDSVVSEYARQQGQAQGDLGQTLRFSGQNADIQNKANFESTINASRVANPKRKLGGMQVATALMGGVNAGLGIGKVG